MNLRPLLLAALALGFASGCSSNKPASSTPPPSEPGTAAAPSEARPSENAPPPSEPGTPAPAAEARPEAAAVYLVRDSGIRCIAPPCPQYLATPVNNPNAEPIQVHELELSAVSGGSDERAAELMQQATQGEGIRLEGTLETRANAGPAGAATVLRATRIAN